MAFPTVSVLDDFNRANGAIGGNWLSGFGDPLPAINTNVAKGAASGWFGSIWSPSGTPASFSAPQEGYYTLTAGDASTQPAGIMLRGTNLTTGTYSGYLGYINGSNVPVIGRYTAGSFVQLASGLGVTPAAGDKIGLEVIGTASPVTINLYYAVAGAWGAATVTFADSTAPLTTGGQVGASWNQTAANSNGMDDFAAGTTGSAPVTSMVSARRTNSPLIMTPGLW